MRRRCNRRRREACRRSDVEGSACSWLLLLWLEYDLHALVLLVLEDLVGVGGLVKPQLVGDDEARVDVPGSDALVKRLHVTLDVALAGLEGQPLVHKRA